jgi:hypothetical protein
MLWAMARRGPRSGSGLPGRQLDPGRLARGGGRRSAGCGAHVVGDDPVVSAGGAAMLEADAQLLRERPDRRRGFCAPGRPAPSAASDVGVLEHLVAGHHLAHDRARVLAGRRGRIARGFGLRRLRLGRRGGGRGAGVDVDQRRVGGEDRAVGRVDLRNPAGVGRRHLDDRLGGLDRQHRLVHLHEVALGHEPADDLRLRQALAEIGQVESLYAHAG